LRSVRWEALINKIILTPFGHETGGGSSPRQGPGTAKMETNLTRNFLALLARFLSGVSVRWIDSQPDTCQRVYFANHTSHLDAIVLWSSLPQEVRLLTRPVGAKDYWNAGPIRRHFANEIGHRYSLIVFPEGSRSSGQGIGEFKSGLYYLCKKRPDLEMIPVHIDNMNRILPRGEVLPVPLLTCISFGPPLWLEAGEPKTEFLDRAREAVRRLREV